MTVPRKPSTDGLKSGLTNISRVIKTSKFKFSNWNIKPFTQLMTKFSAKDYKNFASLTQAMREQAELLNEIKQLKKTADTAKESKNVLQSFFSKVPGKDLLTKSVKGGAALATGISTFASMGLTTAAILAQEQIQNEDIKTQVWTESEIQRAFDRYQRNVLKIRQLNKQATEYNLEIQRTKDRVYALEKQQVPIRQKANDALYEVRAGRKILEGEIAKAKKQANDALYEIREGRKILEGKISEQAQKVAEVSKKIATFNIEQFNNLRTQFNSTVETIKKNFGTIQESLIAQRNAIDTQRKSLNEQQEKINSTKSVASQALDLAKQINPIDLTKNILKIVDGKIEIIQNQINRQIQPQIDKTNTQVQQISKTVDANGTEITKIGGVTITSYEGVTRTLRDTYNLSFEAQAAKWNEDMRKQMENGFKTTSVTISSQITTVEAETDKKIQQSKEELKRDLQKQSTDINSLKTELEKLKKESPTDPRIPKLQSDLDKLNTQIKEQDKLNRTGLDRLGELGVAVGGITALMNRMPRDTANLINPNIPTPAGIQQATGTAICNSLSGGCLGGALNNNANNINNNSNRNKDDLLNKLNTGLQIPELALLGTINNKLGDQLPGGIGGKLERFSKWLHLDRVLNMMIWATTIHNAVMLSNDIGQTLLSAIGNVFQLFGLKDSEGKAFDLGSIISGSIENLIKGIIGADNYVQLKEAWAKANRIYQATVNILNNFQNLASTILTALEMTAGKVAKIGNALRSAGEVLDNAYNWMNPQPKYNRVTQTLENLQNGASTIQMVTQAPLDVIQATTELTNSATELTNAIKDDTQDTNKGREAPEPDKLKADKDASKTASAGKEITSADLDPDD